MNSTLSTSDDIGWAIFIFATTPYQAVQSVACRRRALVGKTHYLLGRSLVLNVEGKASSPRHDQIFGGAAGQKKSHQPLLCAGGPGHPLLAQSFALVVVGTYSYLLTAEARNTTATILLRQPRHASTIYVPVK